MSAEWLPDKQWVRRSFDRAAADYDAAAVLQREVAERLLERLDFIRVKPRRILDLGAGTGHCTRALAVRYPKAEITALDLAPAMVSTTRRSFSWLQRRRHRFVCGDAERLPLAGERFDLVLSNLTLQWVSDLERTFTELHRVLRPGGLLLFTTFGPDTLRELRESWAAADGGEAMHVNAFVDLHDIGDALVRSRFGDPVTDAERLTVTYRAARDLMRDLKAIGAHNVTGGRRRGLTGRGRLAAMTAAYEQFRCDGLLPATHEVVYGHGWKVDPGRGAGDDGFRIVPEQIGRMR